MWQESGAEVHIAVTEMEGPCQGRIEYAENLEDDAYS